MRQRSPSAIGLLVRAGLITFVGHWFVEKFDIPPLLLVVVGFVLLLVWVGVSFRRRRR